MDDFSSSVFTEDDSAPLSPVLVKKPKRGPDLGSLCTIKIAREAPRLSNQRAEIRRSPTDGRALIRFRGQTAAVAVINASSKGAMIESDINPFIGEALQIQFGDDVPVAAVARWVGEGRIGLEFGAHNILLGRSSGHDLVFGIGEAEDEEEEEEAQEPESPAQTAEAGPASQREPRQAVIRNAMVRAGVKRVPVRLCNISPGGVMLESEHCLAPGSEVRLEMAGGVMVTAQVRWSNGRRAGLSFDDSINLKGLSSLSLPPPKVLKPSYLESEFDPSSPWAARFDRLTMKELADGPKPVDETDAPPSWSLPAR